MTDAELAAFLGVSGRKGEDKIMAGITPEQRALYERMANLEVEVKLWQAGLVPKPEGVIICGCGRRGRHKHWRDE